MEYSSEIRLSSYFSTHGEKNRIVNIIITHISKHIFNHTFLRRKLSPSFDMS